MKNDPIALLETLSRRIRKRADEDVLLVQTNPNANILHVLGRASTLTVIADEIDAMLIEEK